MIRDRRSNGQGDKVEGEHDEGGSVMMGNDGNDGEIRGRREVRRFLALLESVEDERYNCDAP